ncbi:hypothetical protein N9N48_07250 [Luminiphilus sp.]|nr:hypothetical protein [Luminiphilus sp.]
MKNSVTNAFQAFTTGEWETASVGYQSLIESRVSWYGNPALLNSYAYMRDMALEKALAHGTVSIADSVLVTAADSDFFPSLLKLLASIHEQAHDLFTEILVFDIGLTTRQREQLELHALITLVSWNKIAQENTGRFYNKNLLDKTTYFFKAYILAKAPSFCKKTHASDLNIIYCDAGIYFNRSPISILYAIEKQHLFAVDHRDNLKYSDQPESNCFNITSEELFNQLLKHTGNLSAEDVIEKLSHAPYVKAGFFGYKASATYQHVIDRHYEICSQSPVLFESKNAALMNGDVQFKAFLDKAAKCDLGEFITRDKFSTGRNYRYWAQYYSKNEKYLDGKGRKTKYCYTGGRQDQSVLSALLAVEDTSLHDSRIFCQVIAQRTRDNGVDAYISNFKNGVMESPQDFLSPESVDTSNPLRNLAAIEHLKKHYQTHVYTSNAPDSAISPKLALHPKRKSNDISISLLHRGASASNQPEFEYCRLIKSYKKHDGVFVLLGNGPSLADVNLKSLSSLPGYSTFGLNAAYRAYEKMGFWPTYFGCFDSTVCRHHATEFKRIIRERKKTKFFFIDYDEKKNDIFTEPEIQQSPNFQSIKFKERTPDQKQRTDIIATGFDPFVDMLTSGTNSIQCGLLMGYRKFILLGCDANYTEIVEGAKKEEQNKNKLVMEKTPSANPNYWFDDYQQEGDRFNLPDLQGCQLPAWDRLRDSISVLGLECEIINASPISQISCFPKLSLADAIRHFST